MSPLLFPYKESDTITIFNIHKLMNIKKIKKVITILKDFYGQYRIIFFICNLTVIFHENKDLFA
ncbi:hypothetical protein Gferi_04120 [Geosporobacter ferrireducens]|uniref:Uncharacterized protein n=1 Tax=Geosporobacter ferrireducens TaxID=1424294 RepID=A0A1D8GD30_9FIRM|nr:hypothetical protein Gferi_04120 [Geosporobacter ferrireducens]